MRDGPLLRATKRVALWNFRVEVGLHRATLGAQLTTCELSPSGSSRLKFGFSANPGHPTLPLARVASGGELSRVLLAFRLATEAAGRALLFDEIDAGAGGKTAERIALSLWKASRNTQVIAVTHWPQVAGFADAHLVVSKLSVADGTTSRITRMEGSERVEELARMLGGDPNTGRLHAQKLLQSGPPADSGAPPSDSGKEPNDKRRRSSRCRNAA